MERSSLVSKRCRRPFRSSNCMEKASLLRTTPETVLAFERGHGGGTVGMGNGPFFRERFLKFVQAQLGTDAGEVRAQHAALAADHMASGATSGAGEDRHSVLDVAGHNQVGRRGADIADERYDFPRIVVGESGTMA